MLEAFDTPWKITNEIWRWLAYPWARALFAFYGVPWGRNWRLYGLPILQKHRHSQMRFGPGLQLRSSLRSNPLGPNHPVILATLTAGACLEIGENFAMTGGTICCFERISIGDRVAIGANAIVVDTDFHPLHPLERRLKPSAGRAAPVRIEDDVFIGMNCLVLKGVTIGQGSVIGAGSVVVHDLPPGTIAAGNPARPVRAL